MGRAILAGQAQAEHISGDDVLVDRAGGEPDLPLIKPVLVKSSKQTKNTLD